MAQPNILQMLFGQQAAAALNPEDELGPILAPGQEGNPIAVTGARDGVAAPIAPTTGAPPQPSASEIDKYLTMGLNNTEAIRQRDTALKAGEAESNRKGMFGVGGTLRDVLGVLGDAFLVQSGNKSLYAPTREKERFADAMAGSSIDPMAAYERALGVAPEPAMDFRNKYVTGENAATRNDIDQAEADRKNFNDVTGRVAGAYSAALATKDPKTIASAEAYARSESARTGIPIDQLLAGGDPRVTAGAGMTAFQGQRLPQYERGLDQGAERIKVAWANARNGAERTEIMRQAFQQDMDQDSFNNLLKLFGVSVDAMEAGDDSSGSTSTTVSPPPMNPADYKGRTLSGPSGTWSSDGKKWSRKN